MSDLRDSVFDTDNRSAAKLAVIHDFPQHEPPKKPGLVSPVEANLAGGDRELAQTNALLVRALANTLDRREHEHRDIQLMEAKTRSFLAVALSVFFMALCGAGIVLNRLYGDATIFTHGWISFAVFLAAVIPYYFFARGQKS
jgi:hypothetical protein